MADFVRQLLISCSWPSGNVNAAHDNRSLVDMFFFAPPMTLSMLENAPEGVTYPLVEQLWLSFPVAVGFLVLRVFFNRFVFKPIALGLGITEKQRKKPANIPELEAAYTAMRGRLPATERISDLAAGIGLSEKKVFDWWKQRKQLNQPSPMTKFQESAWKFLVYFSLFVYGLVVLWDKPWFFDAEKYWIGYPLQHVDLSIKFYYLIELGFYYSLSLTYVFDTRRKDFWEMAIHHAATIFLIVFSYCVNFIRIGTMVLILHDVADIFLEGAKMANYAKFQTATDAIFATFAVVFFFSRLVIYPYITWINTFGDAETIVDAAFPSVIMFRGLLMALQVLHVMWCSTIFKMVYDALSKGKVEKDDRSDDEEEDEPPAASSSTKKTD